MTPMPAAYINRKELAPGITVYVLASSPALTQCWVAMREGTELPVHAHAHTQSSYIVKGHLEWMIDGKRVDGPAGSAVIFAPNQPHGARVLADCEVTDAFTPAREEYLR